MATVEFRYLFVLLPLFALGWASFFQRLPMYLSIIIQTNFVKPISTTLLLSCALLASGQHILNIANVKIAVKEFGYGGVIERIWLKKWDEFYAYYPKEAINGRKELVGIMEEIVNRDKDTDLIAIYTPELFLFL